MTAAFLSRGSIPTRTAGRRRVVAGLVAVGALAVTIVAAQFGSTGSGPSESGTAGATLAGVVDPADGEVTNYSIVYETTFTGGETYDERLDVDRPFRSRLSSGEAARVSDAGVLATTSNGRQWLRIGVPIDIAGTDVRTGPALDGIVAAGQAERLGSSDVAGRACERFLFGGPVTSGFIPIDSVPGESAEVCVDHLGLVLSESWTIDGAVIRTRRAVELTFAAVDDDVFTIPTDADELPFQDGGGAVRPIDPDDDPGFVEYWVLDEVPDGFTFVDRWAVVPPALDVSNDALAMRGTEIAIVTDAYVRGTDLVVIDQGASEPGVPPPWNLDTPGTDIDLGELGTGTVVPSLRMSEVRVLRPEGGFVRVAGTLPVDDLIAIARTLAPATTGASS